MQPSESPAPYFIATCDGKFMYRVDEQHLESTITMMLEKDKAFDLRARVRQILDLGNYLYPSGVVMAEWTVFDGITYEFRTPITDILEKCWDIVFPEVDERSDREIAADEKEHRMEMQRESEKDQA